MRIHMVDPPASTPPYDHALCRALGELGEEVELFTSRFDHGPVPREHGYRVHELFYRRTAGPAGSRRRRAAKLVQHGPDMLRYRRAARGADVVHFQWLPVQPLDLHLLPRSHPRLLTAHDVIPREPRPGQRRAQGRLYGAMDAVVVHSEHGRERLRDELGLDPSRIHVIPHGAFDHLTRQPEERPLPSELSEVELPVVLCFGLMRPYKGIEVLLEAWRGIREAELWVVGRPLGVSIDSLRAAAPPGVRFVPRFVTDPEIPALFRRADLVVLPYREIDQSGVLFTALAFGRPLLLSSVGGFPEIAATGAAELVPPGDAGALHDSLRRLLADPAARERLGTAARTAASGPYSWERAAEQTRDLYRRLRS